LKLNPAQLQPWLIVLTVLMVSALLQPHAHQLYYRQPDGQWFRWITGHYVHADWQHWALNMLALALLPLATQVANKLLVASLLLLPWCISLGFYLLPTTAPVFAYVGLSGVLHGAFMALGLYSWLRSRNPWDAVLCVGLLLKLLLDYAGVSLTAHAFVESAYLPAHVLGVVCGALLAIIYWRVMLYLHA
jgi:rhomboid family GlyGly-CTERM serine protease